MCNRRRLMSANDPIHPICHCAGKVLHEARKAFDRFLYSFNPPNDLLLLHLRHETDIYPPFQLYKPICMIRDLELNTVNPFRNICTGSCMRLVRPEIDSRRLCRTTIPVPLLLERQIRDFASKIDDVLKLPFHDPERALDVKDIALDVVPFFGKSSQRLVFGQ